MSRNRDWESKVARLKKAGADTSVELEHRADPSKARTATVRYLERLRDLISAEAKVDRAAVSNYRLAQRLEIAPNRMSQYYVQGGSMDNMLAYRVAKELGEDPLIVIAEVEAERAVRDDVRTFWQSIARKVAAGVLVAIGAGVSAPSPTSAAEVPPSVYYVKSRRWLWPLLALLPGFADDAPLT